MNDNILWWIFVMLATLYCWNVAQSVDLHKLEDRIEQLESQKD